MREIFLFSEVPFLRVSKKSLAALIALLDAHYQPENRGALSIAFLKHDRLARMHADFCGDPTPTDIITFPGIEEGTFGELCISPQAALDYAKKHRGNPTEELTRYVIHGYLHLLGYDDIRPKDRAQMRRQEKICLGLAKGIRGLFIFR